MRQEITPFSTSQIMIRTDFEIYHYRDYYYEGVNFHSHDFYEFYFLLSGNICYYVEDQTYQLESGGVLVIPPGQMHRPTILGGTPVYDRVVLWVNAGFLDSLGGDFIQRFAQIEQSRNLLCRPDPTGFRYLTDTISRLIYCDEQQTGLKQSYLQVILQDVAQEYQKTAAPAVPPQQEQELIPSVIAYIDAHYKEPISLDQICSAFFVSKYHLSRCFRTYTRSTVYDYILQKRISLARRLMQQGASASEASEQSGFTDYSNFYRAFVAKTGLTPSQFRAQLTDQ